MIFVAFWLVFIFHVLKTKGAFTAISVWKNVVYIFAPEVFIVARARIVLPPELLASKITLSFKGAFSHKPPGWVLESLKLAPVESFLQLLAFLFILLLSGRCPFKILLIITNRGIDLLLLSTATLLFGLLNFILFTTRGDRLEVSTGRWLLGLWGRHVSTLGLGHFTSFIFRIALVFINIETCYPIELLRSNETPRISLSLLDLFEI